MPRYSAGLLLYRRREDSVEVFLVHPGGPYWVEKDQGAWSVPKGEYDPACEDALEAARREFQEETGQTVSGEFVPLQTVKQAGGKIVSAWTVEADCDAATVKSNTFPMEWPPKSGVWQRFPEVDRAEWFCLPRAKEKILKGQLGLIEELERSLSGTV